MLSYIELYVLNLPVYGQEVSKETIAVPQLGSAFKKQASGAARITEEVKVLSTVAKEFALTLKGNKENDSF